MIQPSLKEEAILWDKGYKLVCGVDEVGRGSFAGPVVAGAVVFPKSCLVIGEIRDSKLLRPNSREQLAERIQQTALCWAVAEVGVGVIDKVGVGRATQMAFRKAVRSLSKSPDYILIDAFYIRHLRKDKQKAIIKGDESCYSIAAASILAKVYRDRLMRRLHQKHPQYLWSKNKGYGTKDHQEAIKKHGLSKLHRRSFNLKRFL